MSYVYVLRSCKNGRLYVGTTNDLNRRLREHNAGRSKSTKGWRPFELVYSEQFASLSQARKKEWLLKRLPSGGKLKKTLASLARREV